MKQAPNAVRPLVCQASFSFFDVLDYPLAFLEECPILGPELPKQRSSRLSVLSQFYHALAYLWSLCGNRVVTILSSADHDKQGTFLGILALFPCSLEPLINHSTKNRMQSQGAPFCKGFRENKHLRPNFCGLQRADFFS